MGLGAATEKREGGGVAAGAGDPVLAEAMRIPWMGDQLLAIASITAECLQRLDSVECAMPDITGEERV